MSRVAYTRCPGGTSSTVATRSSGVISSRQKRRVPRLGLAVVEHRGGPQPAVVVGHLAAPLRALRRLGKHDHLLVQPIAQAGSLSPGKLGRHATNRQPENASHTDVDRTLVPDVPTPPGSRSAQDLVVEAPRPFPALRDHREPTCASRRLAPHRTGLAKVAQPPRGKTCLELVAVSAAQAGLPSTAASNRPQLDHSVF